MAEAVTNLRVRIGSDLSDIKAGLLALRRDLAGVKSAAAAAAPDANRWVRGIASARREVAQLVGAYVGLRSVGALFAGVIQNTRESEEAIAQLRAGLASTGGIAGVTAAQVSAYASALQKTTTFSDDAIVRMASVVATFTNIRGAVFRDAIPAILDLSTRLGVDLNAAAIQVGKALNDPVKGITALGRAGVTFSAEQKELIKHLVETGDVAKAQRVILGELATQMGGSATAAADTLSGAVEQAKNAFGDLLEGDSSRGGLKDAKVALQELTKTLNSPEVKAGFASLVNGLGTVVNFAARAIGALNGIRVAILDVFAKDAEKSYLGLLAKYRGLQNDLATLEAGPMQRLKLLAGGESGEVDPLATAAANAEKLRAKLKDVQSQLASMRAASAATGTATPALSDNPTGAAYTASVAAGKASDDAKRKAEALRKELERLEEQTKRALENLREQEIEREQQLQKDLDAAEIELLRATGNNADATFREIEARYGELLGRLRANSNAAGAAIVEQLIDVKKLQARLEEFRSRMQEITSTLRNGETSLGAQAAGGLIGQVEAERQINDLRTRSLEQLRQLRDAVQAYYQATKDPSVLVFLQELDGTMGQVQATQRTLRQQFADAATDSLTQLFVDLATSSKSAGEALRDFVRGFVASMAQIAARALATYLVLQLLDTIYPGLGKATAAGMSVGAAVKHSGGIVQGLGGRVRNVSPLMFGAAPRYHSGGVAGLGPDEVPAILQKGEEVLTRSDPRHRSNGGGGGRDRVTTPIVAFGESALADALAGSAGEAVVVTHVENNIDRILRSRGL